ncbi:MAG: hypothetical protein IID58_14620 [Proteobacteria bacterium]|nr:hypothetical protein [Pseudomonadota bacterium]
MKARFEVTAPQEMEFTMTITMTLKEWEQLRKQCHNEYPGFKLATLISEMVVLAHKTLTPDSAQGDRDI